MAEFSAQDAVRPLVDPSLKGRAVRVFIGLAGLFAAFALIGWLHLLWFQWQHEPLALMVAVGGPLATGGLMLVVAAAIAFSRPIGRVLPQLALVIFLGGVVASVLLVWAFGLLFHYVDGLRGQHVELVKEIRLQDPKAVIEQSWFSGDLTMTEIQSHLITAEEDADNREAQLHHLPPPITPSRGKWASLAFAIWPFQFQLVRDVLGLVGVISFISVVAMFGIWWERKVAGRIQSRLGPMRVGGWHGWAQSLADGIKLLQKEDILLDGADKPLFRLAPYLAFVPAVCVFIALPFSAAWVFRDLDVGLIFILAMLGIGVVGVLLAGWASNNKWSVYGAMRVACQMVSYEIPMGMSLLIPVMTAGTLRLTTIGEIQKDGFQSWLAFANPFTFIAAVTYFMASLASCKRAPFDLPEAESELVSGYHTEYSGFRFSLFFFAEYAEMFAVSALATILFFGAWNSPLPAHWGASWAQGTLTQQAMHGLLFNGPIWFVVKSFFFIYVQIWIRWTLPRIRLDQVMYACVQVLLPLTMIVVLGSTLWGIVVQDGVFAKLVNGVLTLIGAAGVFGFIVIMAYGYINRRRLVGTLAIEHLPGA